MAMPAIVPQPPTTDSPLRRLADLLSSLHAADPQFGLAFCRALHRAAEYADGGINYEPFNATHYRVQSHSRSYLWHYATLHSCSCEAGTSSTASIGWCWHRALLHLLTAHAALLHLDRCPRPTLAHVPPRPVRYMATILRECDDMF